MNVVKNLDFRNVISWITCGFLPQCDPQSHASVRLWNFIGLQKLCFFLTKLKRNSASIYSSGERDQSLTAADTAVYLSFARNGETREKDSKEGHIVCFHLGFNDLGGLVELLRGLLCDLRAICWNYTQKKVHQSLLCTRQPNKFQPRFQSSVNLT